MKLPSLIIAAVVSLAALAPVTASAGSCRPGSSRVSYDHCGRRVVSIYTFVGRDYHGCPIFRWIAQPCYERPVYRGGHGHRDGGRGNYDRRGGGGRGDYHRGHGDRGRGGFSIRISR